MRPFQVRISLSSAVILSQWQTGDALLGGIVWEATEDAQQVLGLPLTNTSGLWHISSLVVEQPYRITPVTMFQSLAKDLMLASHIKVGGGKRGNRRLPRINLASGDHRNIASSYRAIEAPAVWFAGHGDLDAIIALLQRTFSIGTLRHKGFGLIESVDGRETDHEAAGLMTRSGKVARPIPIRLADRLPLSLPDDPSTAYCGWTNPYRDSLKESCYVPAESARFMPKRVIAQDL